ARCPPPVRRPRPARPGPPGGPWWGRRARARAGLAGGPFAGRARRGPGATKLGETARPAVSCSLLVAAEPAPAPPDSLPGRASRGPRRALSHGAIGSPHGRLRARPPEPDGPGERAPGAAAPLGRLSPRRATLRAAARRRRARPADGRRVAASGRSRRR